jgi:polyisoprenoid-binding protein YceI
MPGSIAMRNKRLRCLPFLLVLAACGAPPVTQLPSAPVAALPAPPLAKHQYPIDTAASLIVVTVRRGGPLARLGHDHVIASRTISGYVDPKAGIAEFGFRLDQMSVDETALRREAGLDTQPNQDAIDGTRNNMLTRVLDAERYPVVQLKVRRNEGAGSMLLTVTLHGVTRNFLVPTVVEGKPNELAASGKLVLKQTDFGITPMSVLGGAMVVQDPMELSFRIVARRPGAA